MDWDPVIVRGKIDKTREKEKYVKFMGQEIKLPKRSQYSGYHRNKNSRKLNCVVHIEKWVKKRD